MLAIYEKGNELQSPSWTFSKIFKTSLRNLVSGLFLVQAEDCKCGNSVNQFVLYATYFYPLKTWVHWYIGKACIGHNWVEMKFIYISRITFLNIPLHVTKVLSSFEECRILLLYRRGHQGSSIKKDILKKMAIIRKKPPVLGSLFNNFAVLKAYKFIKQRIQHRCFPVEIVKFLKNTYFEEHLRTAVFILYKKVMPIATLSQQFQKLYQLQVVHWTA